MKQFFISLFLLIPLLLYSQEKTADNKLDATKEPVLSVFTDLFKLKNLCFSKVQKDNKGEVLETQFQLENLTNVSMDLYIFVIATHEIDFKKETSFDKPDFKDKNSLKLIQTYPDDLSNYEYIQKDSSGAEKKVYQKYPKSIKAGINKSSGKPYTLDDSIIFNSSHMSPYIKNYYFFNRITILIFDSDEKLIFRQNYSVKPVKR